MNKYRLTIIISSKLEASLREKEVEVLIKLIGKLGGKVTKKDVWGLKDLKYEIKKEEQGYYVNLELDFPSDKMVELEKAIGINENILRRLMVKL